MKQISTYCLVCIAWLNTRRTAWTTGRSEKERAHNTIGVSPADAALSKRLGGPQLPAARLRTASIRSAPPGRRLGWLAGWRGPIGWLRLAGSLADWFRHAESGWLVQDSWLAGRQANKQANRQAGRQADKQASRRAGKQASRPAGQQASRPADRQNRRSE